MLGRDALLLDERVETPVRVLCRIENVHCRRGTRSRAKRRRESICIHLFITLFSRLIAARRLSSYFLHRTALHSSPTHDHMAMTSPDPTPPPSAPSTKRRRIDAPPSPKYDLNDNDDYVPYVPVAQRRQAKLAAVSRSSAVQRKTIQDLEPEDQPSPDDEAERQRERERKERTLLMEAQEVHRMKAAEGT